MKHCSFNKLLYFLFALAILPQAIGQAPGNSATPVPDHITLTWTDNPAKTITITWRTDGTANSGLVQYHEGSELIKPDMEVQAVPREFKTNLETSLLFTATLTNLSPGRTYSYRVGDGKHWSKTHTFLTADPEAPSFKFLIFGDSQAPVTGDEPYSIWRTTVHNAHEANPDAKFLISLGDLVDIGQNGAHWNAWFAAAAGVIDSIPEMPVLGNHEFYGDRDPEPKYWLEQFPLPQNGPEGLKGRVYSFDYGIAHFVILDSQQEEQRQPDILTPQKAWLDADLAASKAQWKIVFFHRPPYGVMAIRPNESIKSAFCPILEKHHVDLVFSGHDHGIARTCPIKEGVCMEKASQGVIYYIVGESGGKTYSNLAKTPVDNFFYYPKDQPNYLVAELAGSKIKIKTINQDGTELDVFSIKK